VNPLLPATLQTDLVLASSSPRRAEILRMLGFEFEIVPSALVEEDHAHPEPEPTVRRLAQLKAEAAARGRERGLFLGADTVVVIDGDILNKPRSPEEALEMLRRLRGRWHAVYTGIALVDRASGREGVEHERTEVRFHPWDDAFLARYVATGECMDKAGAYAIQGLGALLVCEIRGCFYNVMGLPVGCFVRLLERLRPAEV
jgi:nucleoside triphosphate pyrophosphatase